MSTPFGTGRNSVITAHDSICLPTQRRFTGESGTRACTRRGYSRGRYEGAPSVGVVPDDSTVSHGTVEEGVDPGERDRQRHVLTAGVIIRRPNQDGERDRIVGLFDLDAL